MEKLESSRIWVLGGKIDGVGKSISWIPDSIPSFADCDILIVDPSTLEEKTMSSMNIKNKDILFSEIHKRFLTGLKIICIISKKIHAQITFDKIRKTTVNVDNYFWSPLSFEIHEIPKGSTKKTYFQEGFIFKKYIDILKNWDLCFDSIISEKNNYSVTTNTELFPSNRIESYSGDLLGGEYLPHKENTGSFVMLPRLNSTEESILKILEVLGIKNKTQSPSWTNKIKIPKTLDMQKKLIT